MKFSRDIDNLVSKILSEEIKMKHEEKFGKKGQWMEIEMDEELHGSQSKIDVAKPKGKITAADFKKLRKDRNEQPGQTVEIDVLGGKTKDEEKNFKNLRKDRTEQDIVIDDILDGKFKNLRKDRTEQPNVVVDDILGGKIKDKETKEGNAFTGALAKAKKSGEDSFKVDGKSYHVKENTNTLSLTEDELIDMIENIVKEQIVNDDAEKNNFSVVKPQGLKKTEKAQFSSKKENDNYAKDVVKKMKDYMKDMYMGGGSYDENPDDFPQSNYQMDKDAKVMKYNPSDAVEEYIEAFAYPGMTNLVYDEIKPDDEMIEKQIKGDSKNGNAVTGKDGKALGNVSKRSEKTGNRFKKNFDDNLYGAEQMNVSYKRQTQPVDVAGEKREGGKLSSKKTSTQKAQKIMNQLESVESKTTKIIKEDLEKMRNLISYDRKTQ
jgi:hypothetical protein